MNKKMCAQLLMVTLMTCLGTEALFARPKPLDFEHFININWASQAVISPDGSKIVYRVSQNQLAANSTEKNLYIADTNNQEERLLTTHAAPDSTPTWSPDSKWVYFVSKRHGQSSAQIWKIAVDGGEAQQVTSICTGAHSPQVSPNGKYIAFVSLVYPQCRSLECQCKKLAEQKASKVGGVVYDSLLFRHWNEWRDERRAHLFIYELESDKYRDLTPGSFDVPALALGGHQDIHFSPDSEKIAYTSNTEDFLANSTNNDVFIVNTNGGKPYRITRTKGNDNSPQFSPDGKYIAFLSMARPGFEADMPRLMVMNLITKKTVQLASKHDRPISELKWQPDGKGIYYLAHHHGNKPLYYVELAKPDTVSTLIDGKYFSYLSVGKNKIGLSGQELHQPAEIYVAQLDKKTTLTQVSTLNGALTKKFTLPQAEEFWFTGAKGDKVQGFIIKPPQFRPKRKYPMVLLIHGGPQGVFGNSFHPRWNAQMFAIPGYVVATINFHGSVGYGQEFTDAVSKNWGGAPYEDILLGMNYLEKTYPFIARKKVCAAGASYGGYMINWIAGHSDRFRCLISHAGVFNLAAKYGSTEELWFPEWEFGGTPYENPELYNKWSPHLFVKNFKTPTLVIHGAKDYRVPLEQGLGMFTALQRQGVSSKLLFFHDEDHFVQKPQNIQLWWNTVHAWLGTYLK